MERVSEFLKKEIAETRNFLGVDLGQLNHHTDPLQTRSFTRGKQAAFCIAHGRVVILENAHDELVRALDIMARVFIYHGKNEFTNKHKALANEMAVKALLNSGVMSIGDTCETLLKELSSTPIKQDQNEQDKI